MEERYAAHTEDHNEDDNCDPQLTKIGRISNEGDQGKYIGNQKKNPEEIQKLRNEKSKIGDFLWFRECVRTVS